MFIYLYVSYKMKKLNLTESCQYVACAFSLVNKTSAIPFSLFFFAFFFFLSLAPFFTGPLQNMKNHSLLKNVLMYLLYTTFAYFVNNFFYLALQKFSAMLFSFQFYFSGVVSIIHRIVYHCNSKLMYSSFFFSLPQLFFSYFSSFSILYGLLEVFFHYLVKIYQQNLPYPLIRWIWITKYFSPP